MATVDSVTETTTSALRDRISRAGTDYLATVDLLEELRNYTDEEGTAPNPLSHETESHIQRLDELAGALSEHKEDEAFSGLMAEVHSGTSLVLPQGWGTLHKNHQSCGRSCGDILHELASSFHDHIVKARNCMLNAQERNLNEATMAWLPGAWKTEAYVPHENLRHMIANELSSAERIVMREEQASQTPIERQAATPEHQTIENEFRKSGEFWVVSFDGNTVHMRHSVGLCYIAELLRRPHKLLPATAIWASHNNINEVAVSGSKGEILDIDGRKKFEERFEELVQNKEAARENNDSGRMESIDNEMEQLTAAISKGTGLDGRDREETDAEKHRKSVSGAVSRSIDKISEVHPALGKHLDLFITTGGTLSYSPESQTDWAA